MCVSNATNHSYGTNFVALVSICFALSQSYASARAIIVLVFIVIWGFRLALYLFARVMKEGKDARFDDTRDKFFKFLLFWVLQCITVWIISVPFVLMFSRPIQPALGWQASFATVPHAAAQSHYRSTGRYRHSAIRHWFDH